MKQIVIKDLFQKLQKILMIQYFLKLSVLFMILNIFLQNHLMHLIK
jgi:hypothetical protein